MKIFTFDRHYSRMLHLRTKVNFAKSANPPPSHGQSRWWHCTEMWRCNNLGVQNFENVHIRPSIYCL